MLFFMFAGLIACAGKPVSASCPIEIIPPRVVVTYGDPISVNCSSPSDQIEGMGWESPYGGVPLTQGVSFLPLQINSLKAWELEPNCYINLNTGDQCSESLSVTVYRMADSVSMTPPSKTGHMVEGKNYRMQCDIANVAPARDLSVYWFKGNEILRTESFDKESNLSPVNLSSVFNLTAHRGYNGSHIRCEAKLNLGPEGPDLPVLRSESHDVTVLYPPAFVKPEKENVTLIAGSRISLNCTATGNPMPSYSWQLSHVIQEENKNQDENQPTLTISYPGTYNCTVSNTQGTKTKYFTVIGAETGQPGTTAGILIAVFFVFIFILGWNYRTLGAMIGVFLTLAALLFLGGYFFVTQDGTFSFCKGSYIRGQPTSSKAI